MFVLKKANVHVNLFGLSQLAFSNDSYLSIEKDSAEFILILSDLYKSLIIFASLSMESINTDNNTNVLSYQQRGRILLIIEIEGKRLSDVILYEMTINEHCV